MSLARRQTGERSQFPTRTKTTSSLRAPQGNSASALAAFAAGLNEHTLPEAVWAKSIHHIVDGIGLAFASHQFPFSAPGLAGIAAACGVGDGTVIGSTRRLAPRDAAMANGFLMHGLDFDDTHPASIVHPTVACLPAALAVGEAVGARWGELIAAYVAGMETCIRLGQSVNGGFHHVGFHATGLLSHFSAAVVAGKLLGLDAKQLIDAQGIAASTASGVQVFLEDGFFEPLCSAAEPGQLELRQIGRAHV